MILFVHVIQDFQEYFLTILLLFITAAADVLLHVFFFARANSFTSFFLFLLFSFLFFFFFSMIFSFIRIPFHTYKYVPHYDNVDCSSCVFSLLFDSSPPFAYMSSLNCLLCRSRFRISGKNKQVTELILYFGYTVNQINEQEIKR